MDQSKVIFKSFSVYSIIKLVVARLAILFFIVYGLLNYSENPVFISVMVVVLLALFFSTGIERLVVFSDKFVYESDAILKFLSSRKVYEIKSVKKVSCEGFYTIAVDVLLDGSKPGNKIYIEFENGENKVIRTSMYKSDIKKAITIINELICQKHKGQALESDGAHTQVDYENVGENRYEIVIKNAYRVYAQQTNIPVNTDLKKHKFEDKIRTSTIITGVFLKKDSDGNYIYEAYQYQQNNK